MSILSGLFFCSLPGHTIHLPSVFLIRVSLFDCVVQEAAVSLGVVTPEQFDQWVVPEKMLGPSD